MFIRLQSGEVIDMVAAAARFPNYSLPTELSEEDAEFLNAHIVHEVPPELAEGYEASISGAEQHPDGKYYATWNITRIPPEIQAAAIMATIDDMETRDRTGRGAREGLLAITLVLAQAQGHDEAWLMINNIAYRKFKLRDNEIQALRAKYLLLMSEVPNVQPAMVADSGLV